MADPDIDRVPHAGSMVPITPSSLHHFTWITERERERERESQAKPHQVEGTSMDLEPNLGVALDFAKLCLG
jgi:hypothetical protein